MPNEWVTGQLFLGGLTHRVTEEPSIAQIPALSADHHILSLRHIQCVLQHGHNQTIDGGATINCQNIR